MSGLRITLSIAAIAHASSQVGTVILCRYMAWELLANLSVAWGKAVVSMMSGQQYFAKPLDKVSVGTAA